jgi:hypothetical protein
VVSQKLFGLGQQIVHIAKNLELWIISQVFLQVTVAAIHGAIAGKVDDKIITANLTVAAWTLFEKFSFVSR